MFHVYRIASERGIVATLRSSAEKVFRARIRRLPFRFLPFSGKRRHTGPYSPPRFLVPPVPPQSGLGGTGGTGGTVNSGAGFERIARFLLGGTGCAVIFTLEYLFFVVAQVAQVAQSTMARAGACHHNPVLVAQVAQTNDVTSPAWPLRNHGYLP